MKIISIIALAAWLAPAAGAQNTAAPAQPSLDKPAQPSAAAPAQPSLEKPAQPTLAGPAQPAAAPSAQPTAVPAAPVVTSPEAVFFRPVKNPVPTLTVTTAPASAFFRPVQSALPALGGTAEPGEKGFRPFHSTTTIGAFTPASARQLTVEELRKNDIDEINTLKQSLKGKPQAEFDKAVKSRKTGQNAAIKARQNSDKAAAAKLAHGHPKPPGPVKISTEPVTY